MPEGDTIHRIANRLTPRLTGTTVERVLTQGLVRDLAGRTIASVGVHGKHLLIELADPTQPRHPITIRVHLGMYGRQRSYTRADGEAVLARMSPGRVSLAIITPAYIELWIGARTVEIADRRAPMHGTAVAQLGPDLLADGFDPEAAAERAFAARARARTFGELLLDQRVVAGIGNIYKCEIAFSCGIDPRTPAAAITREQLRDAYAIGRDLMSANLGPGPRTTRLDAPRGEPGQRYSVYGRGGKPCRTCGSTIEVYQLGEPPRWTWSCPRCQPPSDTCEATSLAPPVTASPGS